jgi:transcriptional regulator with XRE-family HTH domain
MNWQTKLQEIRDAGYTVLEIAEECNASRTAISDLATGRNSEPKHALGEALLKMHKRVMRRKPT